MATEDKLREYLKRVTVELTDVRRRLAEAETARLEPIAVIGMSCRYPGGSSVEEYWDLLRSGRSGVSEVPASRWDIDEYYNPDRRAPGAMYTRYGAFLPDIAGWDAEFFGASPQEALRMDPHQRLLMELMWEGLENAGTAPSRLRGSRTAVAVGYMDTVQYGRLETERHGMQVTADPYFGQGVSASVVAGRLAYHYDLRGPAVTIDTACSSSLVGVHLAAQALQNGECDLAVAAGTFLIIQPDTYVQACATSMLAADDRCKTFDRGADGYVMGEGGGLVVLERLSSALRNGRRIRAVLRGSAVNQDGRSNGLTAPSRGAQVDAIRRALAAARVEPDEVGYVEAHGTGTTLGDAIELSALHDVFGGRPKDKPLRVGAVKTNIGHTQSAAGVAGLIKTVLVLERGVLPPMLNLEEPTGSVPEDGTIEPVTSATPWSDAGSRRIAGVSSFGWSGTNAHLVLEAAPEQGDPTDGAAADEAQASGGGGAKGSYTLPISAASAPALTAQFRALSAWLAERPGLDLADVAHTLTVGRSELDYRRALTCTDLADATRRLAEAASAPSSAARAHSRPKVAFLLPGVGDHYAGMGRGLYDTEPVYAAAVDRCVAILDERCGVDLKPLFLGDYEAPASDGFLSEPAPGGDPMHEAETAHPFLFTVEYALAELLAHRGVTPDVLVGYSLGEYVAACLAGVFTLEDALVVVVERARMIASAPPGRMLAVAADEQTVLAAVQAASAEVDVAAINGPSMTVVSGDADGIETLTRHLATAQIACRALRSVHAFHSALLEPAREKLAALLTSIPCQPPTTVIISNRTGRALSAAEAVSADYWADHLVSPVRFADGARRCAELGVDAYIELGAGQTLGGLVRENIRGVGDPGSVPTIVGTLPVLWQSDQRPDDQTELAAACGRLWDGGVPVDWRAAGSAGQIVTLPTYPFQRTRFWPEGEATSPRPVSAPSSTEPADICYVQSWRQDAARTVPTTLTLPGPLVIFSDASGLGAELAARAEAAGTYVVEVAAGSRPEDLREVFAGLEGPIHVVHMGGGYTELLLVLQSARISRLVTVTRGAAEIVGCDVLDPDRAAVHGLGRVARYEYAGLTWQGVDLEVTSTADHLVRELADDHPAMAGWRNGRRWVQDWAIVPTSDADADADAHTDADDGAEPVWRDDGVYLITGGTRGLGLGLARHLVRSGVRRLALVSRNPQNTDIADLQSAGAQVLLLAADVGAPDELRAAIGQCRAHFGALHGVIHAAGRPASGMIQRQTPEEAEAVFAPKTMAMGPFTELLRSDDPPELLVLYSSAITALGGIGEGDYCAANTVLDAYGAALSAFAPDTRVLTVAWGPWLHDDWQVAALEGVGGGLADKVRAHRQRYGFEEEAGCAFLDRLIRTGHGSVVAMRQPMADALAEWSAILDIDSLVGTVEARSTAERFPRPSLRTEYAAPRSELEQTVAEVWGAFLGIDRVGIHDPFFDLGGNSLVGLAMVRALEGELEIPIPPATLFEHPTVAEFAEALDRVRSGAGPGATDLIAISADRGQRRRRARPGTRR
ncbi:acyl transferase domain-containing protein/acyl carrier protein [Catenulispora sp. GAS73]|uniref:type I polyketide synthase n=1 Tax=Catenulispora sp. GAS73 TaxID=3156269 RepID=UPI003517E03C